MSSIQNLFRQQNPYERFVTQLVQLESQTKLKFEAQRSTQNEIKSALGEVSSSISKFINNIKELENPTNNSFQPLSTFSSNKDTVEISNVDGIKKTADHKISIERIAKNDIALSDTYLGTEKNLSNFGNGSVDITIGSKTETITVETQKDDGTGILVDKTNEEILSSFAIAINNIFGEEAQATVFNVSDNNFQLSVKSLDTGYGNRIQFQNATGTIAEITNNTTHLTPQIELDAKFRLDGVDFIRSQNTVDDAIGGLTIELKKATGVEETISLSRNISKAKANINNLISGFNNVNKTIRDRTFIDSENNRRGALQSMRSVRNLTYNLRQTAILGFEGAAEGELQRLSEIGIGFKNNGEMYVENSSLLEEMLQNRPDEVEQLFTAEGSVIGQMKSQAETYTKSNGIISSLENGVEQKIDRLDRRITSEERYLQDYEERQREQFNKLQQIITQGEEQFAQVMSFRNSIGF
ncbi:flagellar filament capping protein FliD [Gracilimonas sp. Q87]|uniref:flagellar filament capping protein FliD n=1 Tax=Gracilimonas sp. Q87 TaxID=3384766 RepID=UPI00398443DA